MEYLPAGANFIYHIHTFSNVGINETFKALSKIFVSYSIQVINNGFTKWKAVLEGSLDGNNFTTILEHTNADNSSVIFFRKEFTSMFIY